MSGDARTTIVMDGNAAGAVGASEAAAEALRETAAAALEAGKAAEEAAGFFEGMEGVMSSVKSAVETLNSAWQGYLSRNEEVAASVELAKAQWGRLTDEILGTIVTEENAALVASTLSAITDQLAQGIRMAAGDTSEWARTLSVGLVRAAQLALQALSLGVEVVTNVRISVIAAQAAIEAMMGAFARLGLAIAQTALQSLADFREAIAELARIGGPALGYLFGDEARRSLQAFADGQQESANSLRANAAEMRILADVSRETAARLRGEAAAAMDEVAKAGDAWRASIDELTVGLDALKEQVEAGTLPIIERARASRQASREQVEAIEEVNWAERKAWETAKQLAAERQALIEAEQLAAAEARAKEIAGRLSVLEVQKAAAAEELAAEQAAAAARTALMSSYGGQVGKLGATIITQQGNIAKNARAAIGSELEAMALQLGIQAGSRLLIGDFAGAAGYSALAGAAAFAARKLGASDSVSGSGAMPAVAPSTTTNVTDVRTTVQVSGVMDASSLELLGRSIDAATRQGYA